MAEKWEEQLRWKRLPGGKECEPFEEEDEDGKQKPWIDSKNVYPKLKEDKNARN